MQNVCFFLGLLLWLAGPARGQAPSPGPLIMVGTHGAQLTRATKLLAQQGHIDSARPLVEL